MADTGSASRPAARRVFITGASSGIGAALARHYAAEGAWLGLVGRHRERLDTLAESLNTDCVACVADVRDASAMRAAAEQFIARFGVPDLVIANAGVSRGTLTELAEDLPAFQAIFDINVMGMVHTFQPFIPGMRQQGRGTLAGIASVAGLRGLPGASAYSASKAAAINYLESLRIELQDTGIKVCSLCPGYIRTPMTDVNIHPMPFMLEADEAAVKMARAIDCGRRYVILPWQMAVIGRLMKWLPAPLWDRLMRRAPHKPRLDWDWLKR